MLTKIDICSMALLKIGERPIQSFNEDTSTAQIARTLFDPTTDALLARHPWGFASAEFELSKTSDGDFLIPVEVLRVLSCSAATFKINGDRISAAPAKITIRAIVRVAPERLPSFFVSVLATRLAMEFCMPISDNQQAFNALSVLFESELRAAKFIDSTMTTPAGINGFSLVNERF